MLRVTRIAKFASITVCLGAALFFVDTNANAKIYSLGDSLSDAGALGFTYTNPVKLSPLTEGNVWVQYITNSTPAFCNDPRHCKFNSDTYYYSDTGNNYAVGGAGVTFDSTDARLPKNFTNLHSQIEALTHNHNLTSEDIVTVWMGANDILDAAVTAAATGNTDASVSAVSQAAQIFHAEIIRLAKFGEKVYVITIPDLGSTPLGLQAGGPFLSALTDVFNSEVLSLATVENIKVVDSDILFKRLASSRQFDNSDIYCSIIIDPKHICGNRKKNPELINTSDTPFVFADPIHPSNAVHRWIGDTLQDIIH